MGNKFTSSIRINPSKSITTFHHGGNSASMVTPICNQLVEVVISLFKLKNIKVKLHTDDKLNKCSLQLEYQLVD